MGIVAVEYTVVYQPPQASAAPTITFADTVLFQGGQSSRDFSITLPDSTFLETGGNFMATLANATIVGGGE